MPAVTAFRDRVTPLIITYNEAPNIERTLQKLMWARHIVVIDSGSTDETLDILARFPQVETIYRPFNSFADQCNFGLAQIRSEWVLSLDADYELTDGLVEEIANLEPEEEVTGYRAGFVYRIYGRALRGSLYPPRTVLYRVHGAAYRNEGHGHKITLDGKIATLANVIYHDDRKSLSRWLRSQQSYASREADYLLEASPNELSRTDRIRLLGWPAPLLVLFYVLFWKGCVRDSWQGWVYALQRLLAEVIMALEIIDRRRAGATRTPGSYRRDLSVPA